MVTVATKSKRRLVLGGKAMTNLDSILKKQRHHFVNKGPSSQSYGFSGSHVQMLELHISSECWRIDAFELWCWGRLLRVPWNARTSNQSILNKINPEYALKGLDGRWSFNTLGTWCKELTHWKRPWCWEWLKVEGEGDDRGWDGWSWW